MDTLIRTLEESPIRSIDKTVSPQDIDVPVDPDLRFHANGRFIVDRDRMRELRALFVLDDVNDLVTVTRLGVAPRQLTIAWTPLSPDPPRRYRTPLRSSSARPSH
jgi:hypothetical protein